MTPDLTELTVCDGLMEAEIIKSKLESREIPVHLEFEAIGRIMGLTMDGLGKVKVMVPSGFLKKAEEILAEESAVEDEESPLPPME